MAKQPNTDAPSDPLEIDATDDPNYDWPENPDDIEEQDDHDQEEADEDSPDDEPSGDDNKDLDPEEMLDENGEPKYVSMERFKELQSSWTKGTQKLLWTIKAQQEVFRLLPELSDDQSKILTLYEENQEVAEIVLKNYYDGITIEQFATDYLWEDYKSSSKKSPIDPDKIREEERAKVIKELSDQQNNDYLAELVEEVQLNEKQAIKLLAEYTEIVNGRTIDKAKVKRYFQTAYYAVVGKRPPNSSADVMKKTAQRKWAGWKGKKKDDRPKHVQESIDYLKDMWF